MIVENGSVTMDLDLNRLNGVSSAEPQQHLSDCNSPSRPIPSSAFWCLTIYLRGPEQGSMALVLQNSPAAGSTPPATAFLCR